jgi:hypothetical protein
MKKIIANLILILISIFVTYGMLEVFIRISLPYLPMTMFNNQCRELRTVGQTSKKGTTPEEPFIAIIGDSYGAGQGDWFADNRYNLNSRYHTAHVLQDITGQDVISLSRAGAGNYDGGGIYAVNTFRYLNDVGFEIAAPEAIVIYFYEGNDISDNLGFMDRYFTPDHQPEELFDDVRFAVFDKQMDDQFCQGVLPRLQDKFMVANLLSRMIEGMVYSATKKAEPVLSGTRFSVLMKGQKVWLPDSLEADIAIYTEQDMKMAVRFLERGLHKVGQVWPDSRKYLVYLPSPRTTYAHMDATAQKWIDISHKLENMVKEAGSLNDFEFIEFAPALREAAMTNYMHGPKDWGHFNRAGYELLGKIVAATVAP